MWQFMCGMVFLGLGFFLVDIYIFPARVLDARLFELTIGGLLRIFFGTFLVLVSGGIGCFIGDCIADYRGDRG
uniref:Uncharacterized protein n=1 Tax=viral metagenome TaxID=1070528 RepID=A0A6H1ZCU7_9ZZZZ